MSEKVERAVRALPLATKGMVFDEGRHDPRFWRYFAPLAFSGNPEKNIDASMTKALINEIAPHRFPETRGKWPVLRARFREGVAQAKAMAKRWGVPSQHEPGFLVDIDYHDLEGMGITPLVQAITEGTVLGTKRATGVVPLNGIGMGWVDIASTLASSLISVGGSVYTARLQKDLQEKQLEHEAALAAAEAKKEEEARKRAEAEAAAKAAASAKARAEAAAAGKPLPGTPEFKAAQEEKAWPTWLTFALIGALGIGGFFVLRRFL